MNRKLKFRIWFPKDAFGPDRMIYSPRIYVEDNELEDNIMQFTGLYDKNGKEIFEGDILSDDEINIEVIYVEGTFGAQFIKSKYCREYGLFMGYHTLQNDFAFDLDKGRITNFAVVGNIFENPKLLNTKEKHDIHKRNPKITKRSRKQKL